MGREPVTFEIDGRRVRDLNGNGQLDPYEDPRRPLEERVADLLARMTLAEKAGLMFQPPVGIGSEGEVLDGPSPFGGEGTTPLIAERNLNHFNIYNAPDARATAEWHNRMQRLGEATRLGIPVTISSDPRHAFGENPATSCAAGAFSQWPEPIGLAATVTRRSFEAVRRHRAPGVSGRRHPRRASSDGRSRHRAALGADRRHFGEDVELAGATHRGLHPRLPGRRARPDSVACMTKHFPGGGPQKDGEDPHFPYGKEQVYPGGRFDYHLVPFEAAFAAGTAQVMPYYGVPVGTGLEAVGFSFSKEVITGLLRGSYGFDGVVCTDWALLTDAPMPDGDLGGEGLGCRGARHGRARR